MITRLKLIRTSKEMISDNIFLGLVPGFGIIKNINMILMNMC